MSARRAMTKALDVLRAIHALDADEGITDPDVAEAIAELEAALIEAGGPQRLRASVPRTWGTDRNRWGLRRGDVVRLIDGWYAGQVGTFCGVSNSTDVYVELQGRRVTVRAAHVHVEARPA